MRWKRERVGTRSQIEMSLFFVENFKYSSGFYWILLAGFTWSHKGQRTNSNTRKIGRKRKKAKLRPTLYRNHKNSKEELGSLAIILFESTLREFYTSQKKPHIKKKFKKKVFRAYLELRRSFSVDTSKSGKKISNSSHCNYRDALFWRLPTTLNGRQLLRWVGRTFR